MVSFIDGNFCYGQWDIMLDNSSSIESLVFTYQLYVLFKFILGIVLYYILIPLWIFPKEIYRELQDWKERFVFNIIVMTGFSTLIFPFLVILKLFGFISLVIFFITVKLLFVKFYYKQHIGKYVVHLYNRIIYSLIRFFEKTNVYFLLCKRNIKRKLLPAVKEKISLANILRFLLLVTVFLFSSLPFIYRGLVSWVEASPDISQFYYWFNLLKKNVIIDRTAGAPYMWGGPMILHSINTLLNIDPIPLVNLAPIFYISIFFLGLYIFVSYICKKISHIPTFSPLLAILIFSTIMSYKFGVYLLSGSITTTDPMIFSLGPLKIYYKPFLPQFLTNFLNQQFTSFWRLTAYLEEEHAFAFFIYTLYIFIRTLETRRNIYLFLFSISLGILLSIHAAYGIIVIFTLIPILLYSFFVDEIDLRFLFKGIKWAFMGGFLGITWIVQLFIYGLPPIFGKALPFLDVLLNRNKPKVAVSFKPIDLYAVTISVPNLSILLLFGNSLLFSILGLLDRRKLKILGYIGAFTVGVLTIHFFSNFGFPPLSAKTRVNNLLALCYSIQLSIIYFLIFELSLYKFLKKVHYYFSFTIISLLLILLIYISPSESYLFSPNYKKTMTFIEQEDFPVIVYKIRREFQPFTYTIVSNVQQFAQVVGKGFHMNIFTFLLNYSPYDRYLRIPTDYVILFVENIPKNYMGLGEFWFRWRIDQNLALKTWIIEYAKHHKNIKLWFSNDRVEVYIIDNRSYTKLLKKEKAHALGLDKVFESR
jgi:hypothetical protein